MKGSIPYALACIFVPVAWGLTMTWLIGLLEKRTGLAPKEEPERPLAQDDKV